MSMANVATSAFRAVKNLPRRVFGTRNERQLKRYNRLVGPINELEGETRGDFDQRYAERLKAEIADDLSEEERAERVYQLQYELSEDLRARTRGLRERIEPHIRPLHDWWNSQSPGNRLDEYNKGEYRKRLERITEDLDAEGLSWEAFAVLRESSRRAHAHRHFDCQLIGGRVLFEGKIAEMKTGEGKTIVCHLPAYLHNLFGHKVHIITVNDYLVKRDAEFAQPIFGLLDISVGYIQAQMDPSGREGRRHQAYGCDITYGTNSEFGFDYLRDNMKTVHRDQVQGRLDFVIVDEVDSILIDEARTPLIISGPAHDDVTRYPRADMVARELVKRQAQWDRRVAQTVARYEGVTHNIPKIADAMNILGYRGGHKNKGDQAKNVEPAEAEGEEGGPVLGPDFLTDDQVEAIQIFENDILRIPPSEQYRRYFIVQTERKQVGITHEGVTIAQELLDMGSLYAGANMEWPHLIENALRAHKVYQRDRDYVVQQGQIIIVDPFTGRLMHGRQWSDGLHQSVEAKENVKVKEETQTLATITIQNFIKLYLVKAGMTGTAVTEATEFDKIYGLDVIEIPTNRPVNRVDHNDKMYRTVEQKFNAIVDEVHEVHRRGRPADPFLLADMLTALRPIKAKRGEDTSQIDEAIRQFNGAEVGDHKVINFLAETCEAELGDLSYGRPVLVGTTSVEYSEKISRLLERRYGIDHEVLNAKNHAREAEIVTKAGQTTAPTSGNDRKPRGNVTIATNMAGRGTDIKLGKGVVFETCRVPQTLPEGISSSPLYPPGITKCCINCEEYDPATNCAHCFKPKLDPRFPALGRKVCPISVPCGLHIIGTERHEARRIDNQLRGRSGRQGDPGSSRFSLSLQDDLLKLFMPDWMLKMMDKLGFSEGNSLEDKRLSKGIERAQRKVEERNFSTRKHLLEWDEPMDYQRKEFYAARQRILEARDLEELIFSTIENAVSTTLAQCLDPGYSRKCIAEWCRGKLDIAVSEDAIETDDLESAIKSIREKAFDEAADAIRTSLGEYIDPEESSSQWDVGGLLQWASRTYKVSMTQNQLRKMSPQEIEDALLDSARKFYEEADLEPISVYLDSEFPYRALVEWARSKFNIEIEVNDLVGKNAEEIREVFDRRVEEAYRKREMSYPVEACLERAFSDGAADSAIAAEFIVNWANNKYRLDWSVEDVQGKSAQQLYEELFAISARYFEGEIDREVDKATSGKSDEEAVAWARQRCGRSWNELRFDRGSANIKEAIRQECRAMLRWELTRLEQFVLLRIYDQAWKDHLLEMDHLKSAIMQRPLGGDQTHPQSQFAIEGRDQFAQMWERIAGRVTDIVFKVRAAPEGGIEERALSSMEFRHSDATGSGLTSADEAAAMRAQGAEGKVATIRREQPRVGRNDPCPCGSGKKFKQCHGKMGG